MDLNNRQIQEIWRKFANNIAKASISVNSKEGERVWFKLDNKRLQGICISEITKGECLALRTDENIWYLLAESKQKLYSEESIKVIDYKRTTLQKTKYSPLKILFHGYENKKLNFYLGGDRVVPKLLCEFDVENVFDFQAQVENSARDLNGYVVSIIFSLNEYSDFIFIAIDVENNKVFTIREDVEPSFEFAFLGHGTWQSSIIRNTIALQKHYYIHDKQLFNSVSTYTFEGLDLEFRARFPAYTDVSWLPDKLVPYTVDSTYELDNYAPGVAYRQIYNINIKGDFLLCRWQDSYIIERVNFERHEELYTGDDKPSFFEVNNQNSYILKNSNEEEKILNNEDFLAIYYCLPRNRLSIELEINEDIQELEFVTPVSGIEFINKHLGNYERFLSQAVIYAQKRLETNDYWLVKGTISNIVAVNNFPSEGLVQLEVTISVSSVEVTSYVSFAEFAFSRGAMILDNGSFFNYFHSLNTGILLLNQNPAAYLYSKSFVFQQSRIYTQIFKQYTQLWDYDFSKLPSEQLKVNLRRDNLVKNRIYRTSTRFSGGIYYIEAWDILENGDVKYIGVIKKVKPFPIANNSFDFEALSQSYRP